jgi:hypothetical protein
LTYSQISKNETNGQNKQVGVIAEDLSGRENSPDCTANQQNGNGNQLQIGRQVKALVHLPHSHSTIVSFNSNTAIVE